MTGAPPPDALAAASLRIDYDVHRWVLLPPPEAGRSPDEWIPQTSAAWAKDLGLDHRWRNEFTRRLAAMAAFPGAQRWDARLIHVLTPDDRPPSLALVNLGISAPDELPHGLIAELSRPDRAELVEPPAIEHVQLRDGQAASWVVHYRRGVTISAEPDPDSVSVSVFLVWRPHPRADLMLTAASPDIGRTMAMRDDLIALAADVHLDVAEHA